MLFPSFANNQPASFAFVATGDLHIGANDQNRVLTALHGAARHRDAAFLALPGDMTNAGSPEQYDELRSLAKDLPMPVLAVMGNHEFHTGPDEEARRRFCLALGVKTPSYSRKVGSVTLVFLSTDRNIDGCSVDIRDSLSVLESALRKATGPVIAFCHAPLTNTVGGKSGLKCFLSDDPFFSVGSSAQVRALVQTAGKPLVWICGHTHSPLDSEALIFTEHLSGAPIHSVNVSSPYFTSCEFVQTEPILVYRFDVTESSVKVTIEDADTGATLRRETLLLTG